MEFCRQRGSDPEIRQKNAALPRAIVDASLRGREPHGSRSRGLASRQVVVPAPMYSSSHHVRGTRSEDVRCVGLPACRVDASEGLRERSGRNDGDSRRTSLYSSFLRQQPDGETRGVLERSQPGESSRDGLDQRGGVEIIPQYAADLESDHTT